MPDDRPGLIGYDQFWETVTTNSVLRSDPSIGPVLKVSEVLAERVQKAFTRPPYKAMAQRVIAGLSVHRLTTGGDIYVPVGPTAAELRDTHYNQSERWRQANDYCLKLDGDTCRVSKKSPRCLAAFSGDVATALMVLAATVELLGPQGPRRVPIRDLYVDDGKAWLAIAPDEMVAAVHVPFSAGWLSTYEKIRVRGAIDFPLVGVAVALARKDGVLSSLRMACTGMASRPVAIDGLESLIGQPLGAASLDLIADRIEPVKRAAVKTTVTDLLYRRRVTPVLVRRLVQRLWDDPVWTA